MTLYAHSGLLKLEIPPQTYEEHILNMYEKAHEGVHILPAVLQRAVLMAVLFHDMGKLIPSSQDILSQPDTVAGASLVNHVDAGVAWCLKQHHRTDDISWLYAAYLIHAHHIGLQDKEDLFTVEVRRLQRTFNIQEAFRDIKMNDVVDQTVSSYMDEHLDEIYALQESVTQDQIEETSAMVWFNEQVTPMDIRFALSILVDCDHSDTARHYGGPRFPVHPLRAKDRLAKLNSIVDDVKALALAKGISKDVVESRDTLFSLCNDVDLSKNRFFGCTAPVGKGKTFSLMNLALRLAAEKERERIFFIIPFTNIISQSVENYRKLLLTGENPLDIVNEIHSKVEYSNKFTRLYSHQWNAPINVSTSVQFFQSLFSNKPSAVRKLQKFANSVVVFDEYHTALPHHLWEVALYGLKEISAKYNIDFVFGSGTHVYYWDLFEGVNIDVKNVVSDTVFQEFAEFEKNRVSFQDLGLLDDDEAFYQKFNEIAVKDLALVGNTVIVCNTVRNAATMTSRFLQDHPEWKVFHMSSYLTPNDREVILAKVHEGLKGEQKILLVATSVIECGVDFSFEIGFREYGSMLSTIQFGGRVNRNKERVSVPIYEFALNRAFINATDDFTSNPSLNSSITARYGIEVNSDNCTTIIRNEIEAGNRGDFMELEALYAFKSMKYKFQVIKNLTESVIVCPKVVEKIKAGEFVSPVEISRNSVSVYRNRLDPDKASNWLSYIDTYEDIYYWVGPYDPELYGIYAFLFESPVQKS